MHIDTQLDLLSAIDTISHVSRVEDAVTLRMQQYRVAMEWCATAQNIVAYPEDFGLTRDQVGGLRQLLTERRAQLADSGAFQS